MHERRAALANADVLILSKLKLALGEPSLLARFARSVVLDIDDAVYVRQPRRIGAPPSVSWTRSAKFAATCRLAALVVAGNRVLAEAAGKHARRVEIVPTPVNVAAYPSEPATRRASRTLVWIGRPENVSYLTLIRPALARLARRFPDCRLRVVSSSFPDWDDVPIERVAWSESGEAGALAACGIGVMPLTDDAWARGKCAFKLLQCMAAWLPCVASPVGMNTEVVCDGENGFLAASLGEWEQALARLLEAPALGVALGRAGRALVEERFERRAVAAAYATLVAGLLRDGTRPD